MFHGKLFELVLALAMPVVVFGVAYPLMCAGCALVSGPCPE